MIAFFYNRDHCNRVWLNLLANCMIKSLRRYNSTRSIFKGSKPLSYEIFALTPNCKFLLKSSFSNIPISQFSFNKLTVPPVGRNDFIKAGRGVSYQPPALHWGKMRCIRQTLKTCFTIGNSPLSFSTKERKLNFYYFLLSLFNFKRVFFAFRWNSHPREVKSKNR